uniref:Uncharacterized protein n=1 Tax=Parastrongyloides trichosuri TaxID=131310 RepID=A0A0N4ZPI4_PARTI
MLPFSILKNHHFLFLYIGVTILFLNSFIITVDGDVSNENESSSPIDDMIYNGIEDGSMDKRSRNPYAWSKVLKRDYNNDRKYFIEPISYLDIPPFVQVSDKKSKNPYGWRYNSYYGKRGRNPYSWQVNPAYQKREFNQGNWFSFRPTRNPYAWANVL